MKIEEEKEELIVNCGVFGYDARKIASILGVSEAEVLKEMDDKESQISKLLQKGVDMGDYVIDLKLFEMEKTGDIKALRKLDLRRKIRK